MITKRTAFPLSELRTMPPAAPTHRLREVTTFLPPARLPNGEPNVAPIRAETAFRLGTDFHGRARLVRRDGRWWLEVEDSLLDTERRHDLPLATSFGLARELWGLMQRAYTRGRGRRYLTEGGRN